MSVWLSFVKLFSVVSEVFQCGWTFQCDFQCHYSQRDYTAKTAVLNLTLAVLIEDHTRWCGPLLTPRVLTLTPHFLQCTKPVDLLNLLVVLIFNILKCVWQNEKNTNCHFSSFYAYNLLLIFPIICTFCADDKDGNNYWRSPKHPSIWPSEPY